MTRLKLMVLALAVVGVATQSVWLSAQNRALNKRIGSILGAQLEQGDVLGNFVGIDDRGIRRQINLNESPTLVLTFSLTCPACQRTFPIWKRLTQLAMDRGIRPVWIGKDTSVEDRRAESLSLGISPFAVFDPTYSTYGQLRMTSVPTTAFVGLDGVVLKSWFGDLDTTGRGAEVEAFLNTLTVSGR